MRNLQERDIPLSLEKPMEPKVRTERIEEYPTYHQELYKIEQRRVFARSEDIGYEYVQAFINNISFPKTLDELEFFATEHGVFNVEVVLHDDPVIWSSPQWAKINDIVFFMHAKTAVSSITRLRTELNQKKNALPPKRYNLLLEWINRGLALYKQFGGKIFAIGRVSGAPGFDPVLSENAADYPYHWKSRLYAEISDIFVLPEPIDISRFNSFIMISRQSGITPVLGRDFEKLRDVIRESNAIPDYFQKSVSSAVPLQKITAENWMSVSNEYRRRFVLEAQFRSFYVDYLLSAIGDRKTILKECRCVKAGIPDSFVDNLVFLNGKYLPVEVKLSVSTQQNLKAQVAKYCYDERITTKDRVFLPDKLYSARVLIVDTESVFLYDAERDSLELLFDLDGLTDKSSIQTLKARILQRL